LKKSSRSVEDARWSKAFGAHLAKLIESKGYKSPYDFWVQVCGEDISRAALNYTLNGTRDVRMSTLRKIADALGLDLRELFGFKVK
jgi:transcriptional regulator with XRE-family HTH domain